MPENLSLSPLERLELARIIVRLLEEHGLVAKLDPIAVSQPTAARLLDCSVKQIANLRRRRDLEATKVGNTPYITMASIRALAAKKPEVADVA